MEGEKEARAVLTEGKEDMEKRERQKGHKDLSFSLFREGRWKREEAE